MAKLGARGTLGTQWAVLNSGWKSPTGASPNTGSSTLPLTTSGQFTPTCQKIPHRDISETRKEVTFMGHLVCAGLSVA